MSKVWKICIPHTAHDAFDYLATEEQSPHIGARVWVPFRNKTRLGVIISHDVAAKATINLKTIVEMIDKESILPEPILQLCLWMSRYYQSPLSEVIALALPKKLRLGHPPQLPLSTYYHLAVPLDQALTLIPKRALKQRDIILHLANSNEPISKKTLTDLGCKTPHLKALETHAIIQSTQRIELESYCGKTTTGPLSLNEEQALAVQTIKEQLHNYHCFLLQGVTGSGKTEVYLQTIAEVLNANKQVLILVPEIGLTPQLLTRFSSRFTQPMAVIHSHLTETQRAIAWQAAALNKVKLIIGTRSALLTPMPTLGLIVIDEEHDSSLKQMDGVRYFARDTALMRAHFANIPIILGSATPSLESIYNCHEKKYTLLTLQQKAIKSTPLHYQLMDMRQHTLQEGLTSSTVQIIAEHLKNNNQVLVFINRRGFAPILLCHSCGWMVDCKGCDSHLTLHRESRALICHHCGLQQAIPTSCKSCQAKELIPIGVGTQRIHEYLQRTFPEVTMLRIDRDEVRKKNEIDERLAQIDKEEVQLIVGTQMLAKGHHFPKLTLVVVVNADAGFYNQDFRAIEQLGQLLIQVAGRAGRAQYPGHVVIQTHLPHHPLLNLLIQQGYDAFAKELLLIRQEANLPPFAYLAVIRVEDKDRSKVIQFLALIKHQLADSPLQLLGPAPAPLARKAHWHRMQLLLKASSRKQLQGTLTALRTWLTINKHVNKIRMTIDVDPQDLS